jgi:signal transduction histidine kinase
VADFAYDSPFATYLRESDEPVMQFDLDALEKFADIPQAERELLLKWQRVFYKPLHAGDSLIAVLAVGSQYTGEGYTAKEYDLLNELAVPVGPLLAQARNLASLGKINEYVFQENQRILREKRHLQELTQLYGQFLGLISPDLRRPFTDINRELQKYQSKAGADGTAFVTEMNNHLSTLKAVQDNLITLAARIQSHAQFHFQPVHMDELAQDTIRLLHGMAEARRVKVDFFAEPTLPAVLGDAQQLQEALHHVMHNAIKFNKIGGLIMVQCGVEESHVFVRVLDNGVGIPQERLAQVWAGFAGLKGSSHGRFSGGADIGPICGAGAWWGDDGGK